MAWIDGGREESQLRFTHAETRRPINWRELSGIVRAVQLYGPRLSGYTVLVETDNMAAKGSAAKRSSRAADMQELVRRLVRLCERHDIRLRLTHTTGLKLDRPDQISRGDLVEEPRQRLTREVFAALESAWAPFESFIGPERHLAARGGVETSAKRASAEAAWVRPGSLVRGRCSAEVAREGRRVRVAGAAFCGARAGTRRSRRFVAAAHPSHERRGSDRVGLASARAGQPPPASRLRSNRPVHVQSLHILCPHCPLPPAFLPSRPGTAVHAGLPGHRAHGAGVSPF